METTQSGFKPKQKQQIDMPKKLNVDDDEGETPKGFKPEQKQQRDIMGDDSNVIHMCEDEDGTSFSDSSTTFSEKLYEEPNEKFSHEARLRVQSYLDDIGFSGTFDLDPPSMKISTTCNASTNSNALLLFDLLTKTNVPPSLALEMMKDLREYVIIKIGRQKGGLCTEYDIDPEEFEKRRQRLIAAKQAIYNLTCCTIYVAEETVTAVGESHFYLTMFVRFLVDTCIVKGFHPVYVLNNMAFERDNEFGGKLIGWNLSFEPFLSKVEKGEVLDPDEFEPSDEGSYFYFNPISEITARRLESGRQILESSLKKLGITWTLDSVKRSTAVSTTSKDPHFIRKARRILLLLGHSSLPADLIIQIANDGVQHIYMRIGFQIRGLCENFGVKEEEFVKRRERLTESIKEINKLTGCRVFIQGYCAAAVGASDGLEKVRMIVEACIVYNVDLADFMMKIGHRESNGTIEKSTLETVTELFYEENEEMVLDGWPMVKSHLEEHGISCALNVGERSMTISKTGKNKDPDSIVKARHLLQLLGTTDVAPSLAIDIMNGLRNHLFMKIGTQEGGLCSIFGIEEGEFNKRRLRFESSFQEIASLTGAIIYPDMETVTLVGTSGDGPTDQLEMVRTLVDGYIVHDVEHECVNKRREELKARKASKKRKKETLFGRFNQKESTYWSW